MINKYHWNSVVIKLTEQGKEDYKSFYLTQYGITVNPTNIMTMSESKLSLIFNLDITKYHVIEWDVYRNRKELISG